MAESATQIFGASLSLLAGFVFVRYSYYRHYSVAHLRADRLALQVLAFSIVLFILGAIATDWLPDWTPSGLQHVRDSLGSFGLNPNVCNAIAIGLAAAWGENLLVRCRMRSDVAVRQCNDGFFETLRVAAAALFVRKNSDAAMRTIYRAYNLGRRIMVTLKSRKVYVGEPAFPNIDPTRTLESLRLIVFASGHRDKDSLKVTLDTYYGGLSAKLEEVPAADLPDERFEKDDPLAQDYLYLRKSEDERILVDVEDLGIVIKWYEIETLMMFDENIYAAYAPEVGLLQPQTGVSEKVTA